MGSWDIETGRKVFFMYLMHMMEKKLHRVTIDRPCRKIASGARNGVIKVEI